MIVKLQLDTCRLLRLLFSSANYEDNSSWYLKSFRPIIEERRRMGVGVLQGAFAEYEDLYNVKLHFDGAGFIEAVEFPSEEEATMFMLKWS